VARSKNIAALHAPVVAAGTAAVLVAAALGGCGEDAAPRVTSAPGAPSPALRPTASPLCEPLRSQVTGRVRTPAATELSGLVASRRQRRVLWTHNDSGDSARVLAVTPAGRLLAEVALAGAENVDWEDIAVGPRPGGGDALYVGDIGDNDAVRGEVAVLRVDEPRVPAGGGLRASAPATRLALRYADGPRDAEALLVDPFTGALVVVTKSFDGIAGVYVAERPVAGATTVLRRRGRLSLGGGDAVTAGDVSADGRTVALRTYGRVVVWQRRSGEPLAATLRRRPCVARRDLFGEGQGEALALTAGGRGFLTVSEGRRPPIRRHAPAGRVGAQ
jgi:hypothetical protein